MTVRVAIATCDWLPDLDEDGCLLLAALAAVDVDAAPVVWSSGADWTAYDLVLVRSCWDYTARRAEFLAWAASVPRLANPAGVLTWNTDKRYLVGLAAAGVAVVPTVFVAPGERFVVPPGEHVVKPTVSAGARDTRRFAAGESSAAHAAALLGAGRDVMVQPYVAAIDEAGETAVLSFRGVHSHAIRKAPVLLDGTAVAPDVVEITPRLATPAELSVAEQVLSLVPGGPLLYARVDLVPGPDGPLLMELEVTEPSLFLGHSPGAADRLAAAVVEGLRA